MKRFLTVAVTSAVLLAASVAQEKPKQDTKPAASSAASQQQQAAQSQPKPSKEMKQLSRSFVGRWSVMGKILDENWAPGGDEGSGTEIVRRGPGGFSTIMDSRMKFNKMGMFNGHGVFFWDDEKKGYTGVWCDTWSPRCEPPGVGKWEGDKLVFTGDMKMGDQTIPTRQTYSNITKNGFDWSMESGDGKGGWKPAMSLKYTRLGHQQEAATKETVPKQ